ncbi:MAG: zf-TFIIB domain-containing protein, partial [Cocleimonas sp.]
MKIPSDAIHCRCGMDFHIPELPNLARSWNCPNCAGSVNPNENCCQYCEAYLAFARCPACFSIAPYDEAKHCAECGESLTLPIKPPPQKDQKVACPRCEGSLSRKVIDRHAVDLCKDCGGVWLEHHKVSDIL